MYLLIFNKKDKILIAILIIDLFIIFILLFNFNFYLIMLDAVFSLILISDIFVDIKNNNVNKKQLLKKFGMILISMPFDLIVFYCFPFLIQSNTSMIKFLRIFRILKLIKSTSFIIKYQQIKKIDRVNKKIGTYKLAVIIFIIIYLCGVGLSYVENIKGLDILYFIIITFSSVGYGDVVVSTIYGKIIAIIISLLSILGIGFLSALFLTYVNIDQEKETISNEEFNDLKGEVNNLKEQNEKIIELLKKN